MIEIRPFAALGHADHGWLQARHHFSFGGYREPTRMGWGALRVWNDDVIAPGAGFAPHPHRDMEIVTYVREGAISHSDDLGNTGRTVAGDVQVMSAGRGIVHAERNAEDVPTRLFQIWIEPRAADATPRWGTRPFPRDDRAGRFVTLASGYPEDAGALPIDADARVAGATLRAGETATHRLAPGRRAYLVVAAGELRIGDRRLAMGDGVAIVDEDAVTFTAVGDAEAVLVEVGGDAIAI